MQCNARTVSHSIFESVVLHLTKQFSNFYHNTMQGFASLCEPSLKDSYIIFINVSLQQQLLVAVLQFLQAAFSLLVYILSVCSPKVIEMTQLP